MHAVGLLFFLIKRTKNQGLRKKKLKVHRQEENEMCSESNANPGIRATYKPLVWPGSGNIHVIFSPRR
jgi:hypothetical protein